MVQGGPYYLAHVCVGGSRLLQLFHPIHRDTHTKRPTLTLTSQFRTPTHTHTHTHTHSHTHTHTCTHTHTHTHTHTLPLIFAPLIEYEKALGMGMRQHKHSLTHTDSCTLLSSHTHSISITMQLPVVVPSMVLLRRTSSFNSTGSASSRCTSSWSLVNSSLRSYRNSLDNNKR